VEFLSDAKAPNNKLIDFESPDPRATDRQCTNGKSADRKRSNRYHGKRYRPDRLRPDAGRGAMSEPSLVIDSIIVGNARTALTGRHQMALDLWFDFGTMQGRLTN